MPEQIRHISEQELVGFLQGLIRIKTVNPPGNEEEAARYVAERMGREGMDVEVRVVSPGRANVLAWLGGRSDTPALMLNGHLDTVPLGENDRWDADPFGGEVREGCLYGRGASDNKGGVAAVFMAALAVHRAEISLPAPVVVVAVMGEETGGTGTTALLDQGIKPRQAIVAEWTSASRIAVGYRGRLSITVETRGRTAHASRPHQGINALEHMTELLLPALKRHVGNLPFIPHPAFLVNGPTLAVTMIRGGVKANVVPDLCRAELDLRLAPGQDPTEVGEGLAQVVAGVQAAAPGLGVKLDMGGRKVPFVTSEDTALVRVLAECIREVTGREPAYIGKTGCSDGNVLVERLPGVPVVAYGPGNGSGHSPNEFVEVQDLVACTRVLATAIPRLAEAGA